MADEPVEIITYFKDQFPNGDVTEVVEARYCNETKKLISYNLDIGWSLRKKFTAKPTKKQVKHVKLCNGIVIYKNVECVSYNKERRPKAAIDLIKKQYYETRSSKKESEKTNVYMQWIPCEEVEITFTFLKKELTCTMTYKREHNHGRYQRKHLTVPQKKQLDQRVSDDNNVTARNAITGLSPGSNNINPSIRSIDPTLGNTGRAQYQINMAKSRLGVTKKDKESELELIMSEYKDYIQSVC